MINYLKNIKKETLIGQLPDVINSNNESIRKEFNWIFDSSLNRLTKSVYAPTGSVKSHFGEFVNLACEYITIKNVDSLKQSIQSAVESVINETSVNHNALNNRFKDVIFIDDTQDFCHDAAAVVYQKENDDYITVKDALDNIGSFDISLNELSNDVEAVEQTIETVNSSIRKINNSIDNLSNDITNLEERNSNNLILDDTYNEITIVKNQYNFIATPISNDDTIIEINFNDDINHEYNFKFILDANVEKVHMRNNSEWYNAGDNETLYINCDNNICHIDYEGENSFIITRNNTSNSAMYDITLNRYVNDNTGATICMLQCKVYEQYAIL